MRSLARQDYSNLSTIVPCVIPRAMSVELVRELGLGPSYSQQRREMEA